MVTLIGTAGACKKAETMVQERVKELESVVEKTVELDSQYFKDMRARRGQVRWS